MKNLRHFTNERHNRRTAFPIGGPLEAMTHPDDVLSATDMGSDAKRELLASWASDAHAVEHAPMLRQLESGAIVRLDDIMSALHALDNHGSPHASTRSRIARAPRTKVLRLIRRKSSSAASDDGDNDPPSPPAVAMRAALLAA